MSEKYKKYKHLYESYREKNREKTRIWCLVATHRRNTGGLRFAVLERDCWKCVKCGMNNDEHLFKFNVALTIDHIDRNRNNNTMNNLQTLCLSCHNKKDCIKTQFKKGFTPWNKGKKYTFNERRLLKK